MLLLAGLSATSRPTTSKRRSSSACRNTSKSKRIPNPKISKGCQSLADPERILSLPETCNNVKDVGFCHQQCLIIPDDTHRAHELLNDAFITVVDFSWYVGDMSRQRAENLLKHEDREGCFVIRNSSTKGMYTLSLFTKM